MKSPQRKYLWISLLNVFFIVSSSAQSVPDLQTRLEQERADLGAMRHVVASLNRIDSTFEAYFPMWSVLDQTLRMKVFVAFRKRNIQYNERDDVYVIASPDTQELVDIHVGESIYGRLLTRNILDRTLKRDLLQLHTYPFAEETPPGYRRANFNRRALARPVVPHWVSASISLFGGELRFNNEWSLIGKVGDNALGYPFWSSGQAWLMLRYKSVALGARLPVHGGLDDFALGLQTRRLNGSSGFAGEVEVEWDALRIQSKNFAYGGIGGSFAVGKLGNRRPELLTPDHQRLFSISDIVEVHYSFDYQFDRALQMLSVQSGVSYHRVTVNKLDQLDIVAGEKAKTFVHPRVSVHYRHQRADWFTLSAELSRLALLSARAELVPGFVFAEARYASVFLRDPQPWEHSTYFYGTIGLTFDF